MGPVALTIAAPAGFVMNGCPLLRWVLLCEENACSFCSPACAGVRIGRPAYTISVQTGVHRNIAVYIRTDYLD